MRTINKIALCGGTGKFGNVVLKALINAKFAVTIFTRATTETLRMPFDADFVEVNYNDKIGLTRALAGHDALISTITTMAVEQQKIFIVAAIDAGVRRIIPSEFDCDFSNDSIRKLPYSMQKAQMEELIDDKCRGTSTTYTFVHTHIFLDWALDQNFIIDIKRKKAEIYNGGDTTFTATPMWFAANGVVAVLQDPCLEKTKNRRIRLHGISLTQNQVLAMAKEVIGDDGWQCSDVDIRGIEKEAMEMASGSRASILPCLKVATFASNYGGDFSCNNENATLGLEEVSREDVKDMILLQAI